MKEEKISNDVRLSDPYVDRRSGEDRRQVYYPDYFKKGGLERRSGKERRKDKDRRSDKYHQLERSRREVIDQIIDLLEEEAAK